MQTKNTMRYNLVPIKMSKIKMTIPRDGEKVESLECSHTASGSIKWYNHCIIGSFLNSYIYILIH